MEDEQPAPTLDTAPARKLRDATAARAFQKALDGDEMRQLQPTQTAARFGEPPPQSATPERGLRRRKHVNTQRPRPVATRKLAVNTFDSARRFPSGRAVRRFGASIFEQTRRQRFERSRVFAQETCGARERFGGAWVEAFKQRQEASAHAHTRKAFVLVHLVGAKLHAARTAIFFRVRAPRPIQKRTPQDDFPSLFDLPLGAHPSEAVRAAPAQKPEQHGLGLIVERVRRENGDRAARARHIRKKLVTCAPRSLLKIIALAARTLLHRRFTQLYFERELSRLFRDPTRVLKALLAAQSVIKVRDYQLQFEQSPSD